jgi:hypothetical protein
MKYIIRYQRLSMLGAAIALASGLTACGSGGSTAAPTGNDVSSATTESVSANTAVVPTDSTEAAATTVSTAAAVVAGATENQTYNCPGGGTAVYALSGDSLATLDNGVLDTGEIYSLTFDACKGAAGAASVTGVMTLTVVSATGDSYTVHTASQNVTVALPQGSVALDGDSTLTKSVTTAGSVTTTTARWTTPGIQLTTQRNARNGSFTLSNVDITRSVTVSSGIVTETSASGSATLAAALPNANWTVTLTTQGAVGYDADGTPTQGSWSITLPYNSIALDVAGGLATVSVDYGADGTVDKTYVFTVEALCAEAG